jgi:hypothetical protein
VNVFFLPGPVHLVAKTQDLIAHLQDQLAVLIVPKSTSTWPTTSGPALRPALRQDPGPWSTSSEPALRPALRQDPGPWSTSAEPALRPAPCQDPGPSPLPVFFQAEYTYVLSKRLNSVGATFPTIGLVHFCVGSLQLIK